MNAVKHHVSDELLLEYAVGSLEEGWSLAVATHLALCPECRARLRMMEQTGGVLLDGIKPETADEEASWATLMDRLDDEGSRSSPRRETHPDRGRSAVSPLPRPKAGDLPEPLRSYVGGSLAAVKWKRLGVGAHQAIIPTGDEPITARLLRVPAGMPVPEHSHGGRELTLVLSGSYVSEGETYGPGDFEEEDDETVHQPMVTAASECICLTVTDAPLRFRSRLVRLVQPFLGI